jgi:hypothetical protein
MNDERFKKVIAYLKKHPDRHAQTVWTNIPFEDEKVKEFEGQEINCGTAACLAGTAAFMFAPVGTTFYTDDLQLPFNPETGLRPNYQYDRYAAEFILDMNPTESTMLFAAPRTIEEMEHYVSLPEDERPAYLRVLASKDWQENH